MSIGTLYYSHSTSRGEAEFQSMPFYDASIDHNRDKASLMSFKSNVKLEEADRIIYKDVINNTTFGGQVVKRSKSLGGDYSYEVMDYTRLYQSKVSVNIANSPSSGILIWLLNKDKNKLSTAGIEKTDIVHANLKWDNTSLWDIIQQLAWLEYKAGSYIYYDIDYTGTLIWKKIPQKVTGYSFSEAYSYEDTHDSSDIITQGIFMNQNNPNQRVNAYASNSMIAKWGYVSDIVTCTPPSSNKKKSTTKKDCKTKNSNKFWTKCGLSPDKKLIVSVAKPSSGDHAKYHYRLYRAVFKNYCPECGHKGYLRFDGGRKTKCITSSTYGHAWKDDVQAEHEITCIHCDSDYCGVTGQEKSYGHTSRLKVVKKPVKSSQKEYNKLTSGKLVYEKGNTSKCDTKNNGGSTKNEKNIKKYNIASSVWKQAVAITSTKNTDLQNAKAIFKWMKAHTVYEGYYNTRYGAAGTLKRRKGNCVDHAHLFAAMCRSIGLKCNYIHNSCIAHVYNKVYIKGKGIIVDTGRGTTGTNTSTWGSHYGGSGCPVEKTSLDF